MKKIILAFALLIGTLNVFAQAEYNYDRPESSRDPWKFGLNAYFTYDWISMPRYSVKKPGVKVGVAAEKHLVYNIYFRPTLNFIKKGCDIDIENNFKDEIRGYLLDIEANIEMKFGNERKGSGLVLFLTPFFSYGIAGTGTSTDLNPQSEKYQIPKEYETFADNNIAREDVGFILGAGYDFNHHLQLDFNYMIGFFSYNDYNNFRWRSMQLGLTYFF